MLLEGKRAFVTGASGGLGGAISVALAHAGADVAVGYRSDHDRAQAICDAVRAKGRRAVAVLLEQSHPESVATAVGLVVEAFGGLDLLVNNAGMASGRHAIPAGDLDAFTPEVWDEMMAVNARGPFVVTRAAAPHLKKSGCGRVINIGSTIGHGPWGASAAYAPSKGAVTAVTRFLAAALAPEVTVNAVSPGLIVGTGMSGGASQDYVEGWAERALLKRTTAPEDVARQVVMFCASSTVTGQSVVIDGGIHFD